VAGRRLTSLFVALSLVLSFTASLLLLVQPSYESVSQGEAISSDGTVVGSERQTGSSTLVEHEGTWVLWLLGGLVAVPALTLAAQRTRLAAPARVVGATALGGFALLAGFSIGLLYLPAALAMVAAAMRA
jgi:hypothetical protein